MSNTRLTKALAVLLSLAIATATPAAAQSVLTAGLQHIQFKFRASVFDTTDQNAYSTSSTYTPAASALIVVLAVMGTTGDHPTISGHGLTWSTIHQSTGGGPTHSFQLFAASAGASPTSSAVTITRTSGNGTVGMLLEFEILGVDTSNGTTSAIVQEVLGSAGTGTTATVSLSAAGNSRNRAIALVAHLANEATTPRANWTEPSGADGNVATPSTGVEGQYRTDAFETTASATFATSSVWRIFALELKAL